MWTAAFVTDTATRDLLISSVVKYASGGFGAVPFDDWYDTTTGAPQSSFAARPVIGSHLALVSAVSTWLLYNRADG